ncbi:peptidase [Streptococcus pneumoniae]|nr:peptidase [Streptococcus pneumoniae]
MKMNKKNLLATLALSTIALAQAGYVSADELAPIDSSAPATEVVTPTTPSASTETEAPATQPTEPSVTPVDPTTPSVQDKDNAGSLDGVPTDKPAPSDKPQDKDNAGSLDGVPTPSDKPQDKDNAGSLDGVPAEKPKTTDQANQQGKSQIGTTSTSTGQVVHDVTKAPIQTNTGASIVSTQNGNLVLEDGSVVAPETIGAVSNEDKTITVTKADGTKATLPYTGEIESSLKAIGVGLLTVVGLLYKKRYL